MKPGIQFLSIIAAVGLVTTAQAKEVKVAYLPCGQINDHSWSETGYEGMKLAQQALAADGIQMTLDYTESLQAAQVEPAARDYASRGYATVVLHCATFSGGALNAAKAFPNTKFLVSTSPDTKDLPKNFWFYDASQQEASFLAGYLGGLMSKSGRVGAVGGFDFPALVRQVEGFRLGARYANPKMKSFATYINSWEDAGKAKEAAQAQIDSGADVIFTATDQAARGAFTAAENSNAFAIASYTDQANLAPKNILTSVLYDYPRLVKMMVVMAVEDKLEVGKAYAMGVTDGVGDLAYNPALDSTIGPAVKAKVTSMAADIKAGKIKVPMLSKPNEAESVSLDSLAAK
jgi:basic membrane protein A